MADALSQNTNVMELVWSLSPLVMMILITGSSYPKVFLIKVLHVLKLITEFVLTTLDSKPLEKATQNYINDNSKDLNQFPSPVLKDKCDCTCPLTLEKECSKQPHSEVEEVQMEDIQKSMTSFNVFTKETVAQIAKLKQSIDLIKSQKHENEQLTIKSNQQREDIILLKGQIPKKPLKLPRLETESDQINIAELLRDIDLFRKGCSKGTTGQQISKKPLKLPAVNSEIQTGQAPKTVHEALEVLPDIPDVLPDITVSLQNVPFENMTTDKLDKIAHHIPRFETASDNCDIVGYLRNIDYFLKGYSGVTTDHKIQLIVMTSGSEVRRFIDRQPSDVVENYDALSQSLIGEYQVHKSEGISAALSLRQKKGERPSTFFSRLRKAWFSNQNTIQMEEDQSFKSFFLNQLDTSIRPSVRDNTDKNMSSSELRTVADRIYNNDLIEMAWEKYTNQSHPQGGHSAAVSSPVLSRRKKKALLNSDKHRPNCTPAERSVNWRLKSDA